jgi:hypothetical protein
MIDLAACRCNDGGAPAMRILLLNLFGTILLAVVFERPGQGLLSRRLAALRAWPCRRNFPPRQ